MDIRVTYLLRTIGCVAPQNVWVKNIYKTERNYRQNEKTCSFCKWKTVVFTSSRCHSINQSNFPYLRDN